MAERPTKEKIIQAAEELMLRKGFHSVGLTELLKAVQVPKGSFYHYFESKEQFGVELLRHYLARANAHKRRLLLEAEGEPNARLRLLTYLETSIAAFLECGGQCPCLIAKLAAEVATFSEPMRLVLAEGQAEGDRILGALIEEGSSRGQLRLERPAALTAALVEHLWSGAMQRAIIVRQAEPLRVACQFIAEELVPAS